MIDLLVQILLFSFHIFSLFLHAHRFHTNRHSLDLILQFPHSILKCLQHLQPLVLLHQPHPDRVVLLLFLALQLLLTQLFLLLVILNTITVMIWSKHLLFRNFAEVFVRCFTGILNIECWRCLINQLLLLSISCCCVSSSCLQLLSALPRLAWWLRFLSGWCYCSRFCRILSNLSPRGWITNILGLFHRLNILHLGLGLDSVIIHLFEKGIKLCRRLLFQIRNIKSRNVF